MTEKRYNVWDIDGTIFLEDHKEGSYHIGQAGNVDINCLNDIAKLLNDLSDENEQLKIRFNEEREKSLKFCRNIDTLTIENEHIKNTIQEAYNNERTAIGKSVLKQLMEAIQ